jgi:membrane dipeptidase
VFAEGDVVVNAGSSRPERTAATNTERSPMEPKKRWDGYVSFSYLEPGVDYKEFELSPQLGRVEPFIYPLSDADQERAERLLRESVCI